MAHITNLTIISHISSPLCCIVVSYSPVHTKHPQISTMVKSRGWNDLLKPYDGGASYEWGMGWLLLLLLLLFQIYHYDDSCY